MKRFVAMGLMWAALCAPVYAQLGGAVLTDEIHQPLVLTNQRAQIAQETISAHSLTVGGGAGMFRGLSGYLGDLTHNLDPGVSTTQRFGVSFPGPLAKGPGQTTNDKQMAQQMLASYSGALQTAQQQANGFADEDSQLETIEARNQSCVTMLCQQQVTTEAVLALAQQVQLSRQLELTHLMIDAVSHGYEINEFAREHQTNGTWENAGIEP